MLVAEQLEVAPIGEPDHAAPLERQIVGRQGLRPGAELAEREDAAALERRRGEQGLDPRERQLLVELVPALAVGLPGHGALLARPQLRDVAIAIHGVPVRVHAGRGVVGARLERRDVSPRIDAEQHPPRVHDVRPEARVLASGAWLP